MHSFTSDPARGVIEITVAGFWTLEEFGEFTRALQHHIRVWPGSTPPMSLYNYTDAAIQSQDVVAAMQHLASTVDPTGGSHFTPRAGWRGCRHGGWRWRVRRCACSMVGRKRSNG